MELTDFYALIDAMGGDEYVLGISMDNACRIYYTNEEPFDRTKHIHDATQTIIYTSVDTGNNNYTCAKPLGTVQGVIFTDSTKNKNKYNTRILG